MPKEINLLPRKNKGILEQENTVIIARIIAIFSVIFVISSAVGGFFIAKNYSLSALQAEQQAVVSKFQQLNPKTIKILMLNDRATHIQNIIQKRIDLTSKITILQQKLPTDVNLDSLNIDEKTISFAIKSKSLSDLQQFLNTLTTMVSSKQLFQQITIDTVSADITSGEYTVNVKGTFL